MSAANEKLKRSVEFIKWFVANVTQPFVWINSWASERVEVETVSEYRTKGFREIRNRRDTHNFRNDSLRLLLELKYMISTNFSDQYLPDLHREKQIPLRQATKLLKDYLVYLRSISEKLDKLQGDIDKKKFREAKVAIAVALVRLENIRDINLLELVGGFLYQITNVDDNLQSNLKEIFQQEELIVQDKLKTLLTTYIDNN